MSNAPINTLRKYQDIGALGGLSIINVTNPRAESDPVYKLLYSLENNTVGHVCTSRSDDSKTYKSISSALNDAEKILGRINVLTIQSHDEPVDEYIQAKYIEPFAEFNLEQQTPYKQFTESKESSK